MNTFIVRLFSTAIFIGLFLAVSCGCAAFQTIYIIQNDEASAVEKRIVALLSSGILEQSQVIVNIRADKPLQTIEHDLVIYLGQVKTHRPLVEVMHYHSISIPDEDNLGPEGFVLWSDNSLVIAAGVDERGCLYAVGEILRQIEFSGDRIFIPPNLDIHTAPAFEVRGTQFGQSGVAKQLANVRTWTDSETERVILDYALAGANVFSVDTGSMYDFIRSYGLMTQGRFGANTAPEVRDSQLWQASESIGRIGYVCLSVREAEAFMLQKCDEYFSKSPFFDFVKFHGGDGGGCECDQCDPYGHIFIKTVEKMAAIIHKYHPDTRIYFTNQKFDNDDDEAIFKYLNESPRKWLWAWGFGPGSDATTWQPGHRQTHRMDLFRYPGYGPYSLYPKEILHRLPKDQKLIYYNEITHWKYAQHAYIQMYPRADRDGNLPPHWSHDIYERMPDQALTMVYNRLTFFAWPKYYHRVFNDLMRYGEGDITHSSGHHDHFNQWMWQRLLWSPRKTVEDVVNEYCHYWFGPEAAVYMARAIFLLEENMKEVPGKSISEKEGIDKYYFFVKKAGEVMDSALKENNWLYLMFLQKGVLDLYTKLRVAEQEKMMHKIQDGVRTILNGSDNISLSALKKLVDLDFETEKMRNFRNEARELGEKSNKLFGVRSDGYFNLSHDFIGLGWVKRQLERAEFLAGSERNDELRMIVEYENPGEGGFYDNLGTYNDAPNVKSGYPYDHGQPYVSEMLSEANLPSQRTMHFTQNEENGVTLFYDDLDTTASYEVRFTLVRPWYQERYAMRMNQKSQSVYADDSLLVKDVELPLQMSDFFTYDIPHEATADGELTLMLKKSADVAGGDRVSVEQWRNSGGWGTIVSEVWLMKK